VPGAIDPELATVSNSPEMQSNIRRIQEIFAEHRPLSYEEWVDGFITEARPEHEIAIWLDAVDTYAAFTKDEPELKMKFKLSSLKGRCGPA